MDVFRWAYIGSGKIAKRTARNITKGNHVISAVYSRNPATAKAFAAKYGAAVFSSVDELLASDCFDAVYIATPHNSHLLYAMKALQAGKPVLCEKPAGVSEAQAAQMLNAARDNGVYFCEAMWTWFSDVALTVKRWIGDGKIGKIKNVRMTYAIPGVIMSKTSRLLNPETAGGALLDIGIYPIAYCYHLFGYPQTIRCSGTLKNGIDIKETVIFGYDGFTCTLHISLANLQGSCRITGEEGVVRIPFFYMADRATLKTKDRKETFTGKTDYLTEFSRAAEEIRTNKTKSAYVPPSATRDCMRILDECRKQMKLIYPFEKTP